MNTDIFRNCIVQDKIIDDLWIFKLKPNDKIWLVKENCFGIVHKWICNSRDYDTSIIIRITFRKQFHDIWFKELWLVRPSGKGFDQSQVLLPVNKIYQICPYLISCN